jgi:hypothetical protein
MKNTSNFYSNKTLILLMVFCLVSLRLSAQTDKKAVAEMEESMAQYEKNQQVAIEKFVKKGIPRVIEGKDGSYSELAGENAIGQPLYLTTTM